METQVQDLNKQDCDGNTILHKECRYDREAVIQACYDSPYQKWPTKSSIHLEFSQLIVDALLAFYKETGFDVDELKKIPFERGNFRILSSGKVIQASIEASERDDLATLRNEHPGDDIYPEIDWPISVTEEIVDFLVFCCRHRRRNDFTGRMLNTKTVSKLITSGAKLSIENNDGKRPIDLLLGL